MEHEIIDNNFGSGTTLSPEAIGYLKTAGKWGKFIAIMGFIGIGLMVLMGVVMGTVLNNIPGAPAGFPMAMFSGLYLVLAIINFFPTLYLYRFSSHIVNGLEANSPLDVTTAFSNLKSLLKFIGILIIVIIAIYLLIFIGAILAGSMLKQ